MTETVDVSKLREGDVVHVRGVMIQAGFAGPLVCVDNCAPRAGFHHSRVTIVSVEPRPLKVGDRVNADHIEGATILCIDGDDAWIKCGDRERYTASLSNLSPA